MGLKPRVDALTFKSKLLPEDLPDTDIISLPEAVAWLSGLPVEQAESSVLLTPNERCQALLSGRRYKSAGFWLQVLSEVNRDNEHSGRWDWSTIEFITERKFANHDSQRARNEHRLIQVVERVTAKTGISPQQLLDQLLPIRQTETDRIWSIREALLNLVSNLEGVVSQETLLRIRNRLKPDQEIYEKLHLSLACNAVFLRADADASDDGSVELWKRRCFQPPAKLITERIDFDRSALVRCFVDEPNRILQEWAEEVAARPYWPIGFCAVYISEMGELEKVFQRLEIGSEFDAVAYTSDDPLSSFDNLRISSLSETERLLRRGDITAYGVRAGGCRSEPVPIPECLFMEFELEFASKAIRLVDKTRRTTLGWDHICIKSDDLKARLRPQQIHHSPQTTSSLENQHGSRSQDPAFDFAIRRIELHNAKWSISYDTIHGWLTDAEMIRSERAWERLKHRLGLKFEFLTRKGARPKTRPPDWPWD